MSQTIELSSFPGPSPPCRNHHRAQLTGRPELSVSAPGPTAAISGLLALCRAKGLSGDDRDYRVVAITAPA